MLCSVVKHLGSGRALKKWGKTLDFVSCFPLHFCRALPLPACFTTEQSTVEASLFVKYKKKINRPKKPSVRVYIRPGLLDNAIRLDNAIHRINHYPADSVICFVNIHPLESDLTGR